VIVTSGGTAPSIAAKAATSTIPIVFAIPEDPVKLGLIASLARPGGNLTGVNFFNVLEIPLMQYQPSRQRDTVCELSRIPRLTDRRAFHSSTTGQSQIETGCHFSVRWRR